MTQLTITSLALRKPSQKRRKSCPFSAPNTPAIDYKDLKVLTRYVSERGKIIPSRIDAYKAKKSKDLVRRDIMHDVTTELKDPKIKLNKK